MEELNHLEVEEEGVLHTSTWQMSYFDTLFYKRALDFESQRHRDYSGATCSEEDIKQKSLAQL